MPDQGYDLVAIARLEIMFLNFRICAAIQRNQ